jgi:hypothetical protein
VAGEPPPNSGAQHHLITSIINNSTNKHPMDQNDRASAFFKTCISDNNAKEPPPANLELTKKHEWDTPTRVRVKTLFDAGVSRHAIEQRTNVPVRSQQRISKGSDRRIGKNRVSAPRKLSKRDLRTMVRFLTESFETRQSTWQQLANDYGGGCHPDTVKAALNSEGYCKCKACQMTFASDDNVANRLSFAKQFKDRNTAFWRSVRFTDEVHFSMESRAAAWVTRTDESDTTLPARNRLMID